MILKFIITSLKKKIAQLQGKKSPILLRDVNNLSPMIILNLKNLLIVIIEFDMFEK